MASSRENADDDDTTSVAARSQRLQGIVEAYLTMLAREQERVRRYRRRNLQPCRRHSRPLGAAGAGGVERARGGQGSGAGRAGAQGAGPRQADQRATRDAQQRAVAAVGRARRQGRPGDQRFDQRAARRSHKARQEIGQRFPAYADLVSPKPPIGGADQGDADGRRGDAVVLFRAKRQFRLGRSEEWAGRVRRDQGNAAAISRARFASCARRWSRRRR